jgi:ABC-type nitrate/sulfonate/bicarbonate transport system permease component
MTADAPTPGTAALGVSVTAAAPTAPAELPSSHAVRRATLRLARGVGGAVLSVAVICGVWQLLVQGLHMDPFLTRGPLDVWRYLASPANGAERTLLWQASKTTALDALIGLLGGTLAALVTALAFALWRSVEQTLLPVGMALRAVPMVAMTPLIALIFGRGLLAVTVIAGIVTFFPVLVNVSLALRAVPASALDLMRAYGASPYATLWRVQLPGALPALFAAIRVAAPLALVGALLAEWLATGKGLGYLMLAAVTTFELDRMWTGVTIVTVASIVLYTLVSTVEQLTLARYAPDQAGRTL